MRKCFTAVLPELLTHPFIEIASVCGIVPDRAKRPAEKFKVAQFHPGIDEMLAGAPFDLLVNLTSMQAHYEINRKALEARRNVWSEKPMAAEVRQGRELLKLAKKNKVQIWPAPTCVLSPAFRFMAETIASGKLGRVTAAHGSYGHNGPTGFSYFGGTRSGNDRQLHSLDVIGTRGTMHLQGFDCRRVSMSPQQRNRR